MIRFILFLVISIHTNDILAITVYRGDSRGPNDIFINGFQSSGQSLDLIRHITGESCHAGTTRSGYISTSINRSMAYDFAEEAANSSGADFFYVYDIETDSSYIDVTRSLMVAANYEGYTLSQRIILHDLAETASSEDEVVSEWAILPQSIIRVHVYNTHDGQLLEIHNNPHYQPGNNTPPGIVQNYHFLQLIPPNSVSNATTAWFTSSSSSGAESNSSVTACFMGGVCSNNQKKSLSICYQQKIFPLYSQVILFDKKNR